MSTLDRLTDDDCEAIVEAIGALTEAVEKAGVKISIQHSAALLGFVRLVYPDESRKVGRAKPFDIADGAKLDIAEGTPCETEGPLCKFGPGGDFVRAWPQVELSREGQNGEVRCGDCRYFFVVEQDPTQDLCECRRFPPVVINGEPSDGTGWPLVYDDGWCGEFQSTQPRDETPNNEQENQT